MPEELITVSTQELKRIDVIKRVIAKQCTQKAAELQLNLSKRQIIRLVKEFRQGGEKALLSKQRGKVSNNALTSTFKMKVKKLVELQYADFGPTLASEKLLSLNEISISKETLRHWMSEWDLWKIKPKKITKLHQTRERRSCFGELIQIDGSHHDWFEGRREKCCLLVFIDDATSQLIGLRFEEQETTVGYFRLCRSTLETHGRPLAYYSDKFSVFRVNQPESESCETQFKRALGELDIELICAHSPQAKGRVERVNATLQDRLVKELRLRGINTLEDANAYCAEYMIDHNKRFAVTPKNERNAHRLEIPEPMIFDLIFSFQYERTLSKQLECRYDNRIFQIQNVGHGYRLQNKIITVSIDLKNEFTLLFQNEILAFKEVSRAQKAIQIIDSKALEKKMNVVQARAKQVPAAGHPWRRYQAVADKKLAQALRAA